MSQSLTLTRKEIAMKRLLGGALVVFFILSLIGFVRPEPFGPEECSAGDLAPMVTLGTPLVKMDKKATVVIMGSGFPPDQEIRILLVTAGKADSDLDGALKPDPKVDGTGNWASTWDAGMYIGKDLLDAGVSKLVVTDAEYNPVAHTPIFVQKEEKPKEDKKKK
jgi:hypothetical protein